MAIDVREDGTWVVTTAADGSIVQTKFGAKFAIVTKPEDIDSLTDFGARTAARIQHSLNNQQGPK